MHYLIDGYNFFFLVQKQISPITKMRTEFLSFFAYRFRSIARHITIIFDYSHIEASHIPKKELHLGIEVIYTPKGVSADDFIIELLSFQKHTLQWCVVTQDKDLKNRSIEAGARVMAIDQFVRLCKEAKEEDDEKGGCKETEWEFHRLHTIFMKKLQHSENDEQF